jgi:hypothetical protein
MQISLFFADWLVYSGITLGFKYFPTQIIFKMDDDGSALRVGAKYKSFTDLVCPKNIPAG